MMITDPAVSFLSSLFVASNPCDERQLQNLLECAYLAGKRDGIEAAMRVVRPTMELVTPSENQ